MPSRKILIGFFLALVASTGAGMAQSWPAKPIKVVIPFGAGSAADVVPRLVLDQVSKQLGQPIIIENRPGAGSTTGSQQVAKSDPDGYTFLATTSAYVAAPAFFEKLGYDPLTDLVPVGLTVSLPSVLIVPASLPVATVKEFVTLAKEKAGTFNYASLGAGSGTHLAAERFRAATNIDVAHVAFKSGAEALTEIIAGRVQFYMCPVGTALPFIKDGKVKALAVAPAKRVVFLPDLPTTLEAGYPESDSLSWIGLLAPKGTPADVVMRLQAEVVKALAHPDVAPKLALNGVEADLRDGAAFGKMIAEEIASNVAMVKRLGLKAN